MHFSTTTLVAALLLAALTSARAGTSSEPIKITGRSAVYYGDLDLNAAQDAKIMLERIEQAAKKACGGHTTFSPVTGRPDNTFAECRNEAVERTVKQLDAPLVTRVFAEARPRES
jgi:UrcA family protein